MLHRSARAVLLIAVLLLFVSLAAAQDGGDDEPLDTPAVISVENAADLAIVTTLAGHESAVNALDFNLSGDYIVTAGNDISLRLWSVADGRELSTLFEHFSFVKDVAFSPVDPEVLASVSWDRSLLYLSIEEDQLVVQQLVSGFRAVLERLAFLPDGQRIVVAVGDGEAVILSIGDTDPRDSFTLEALQVTALAVSPDGSELALAGGFPVDSVIVWDIESGEQIAALADQEGGVTAAAFSPDGDQIATGAGSGGLILWENGEPAVQLETGEWVTDLTYSPDGALLAVALLNGQVQLWDVAAGEMLVALDAHDGAANAVTFSRNGRYLGTAGDDRLAHLWALTTAGE
jgi:WD40 repeat protein